MSLKSFLIAGSALASLFAFAGSASAEPYYSCNGGRCYDDQAEQTRELNLMQLEHPGAGVYAVPGYHGGRHGMRHRDDDDDRYGDDDDGGDRTGDDDDDDDDDRGGGSYGGHQMHRGDGGSDSGGYRAQDDDDRGYGRAPDDDYGDADDDDGDDGDD